MARPTDAVWEPQPRVWGVSQVFPLPPAHNRAGFTLLPPVHGWSCHSCYAAPWVGQRQLVAPSSRACGERGGRGLQVGSEGHQQGWGGAVEGGTVGRE